MTDLINTLIELGAEIQFFGKLRRLFEDVYLKLINNDSQIKLN